MHRNDLITALTFYQHSPLITPEEVPAVTKTLEFIATNPCCFDRNNPSHITGSAWIVNYERTHALLTHHRKLNIWVQLGGHADGDPDIKQVALKEAQEESGIKEFTFLIPGIFDVGIHYINEKCQYHYDIRYLLQAPLGAQYIVSEESHDLAWVPLNDFANYTSQRSVLRMAEKME